MAEIFVSYARADDEPFVKRLHEDLTAAGFSVWWDREAMESRGRTFLQEIRDAIASVDRLILVVGPKAVRSDYVRVEWEFGLEACTIVLPILRLGDYSLVPSELSKFHCPDFRTTRPYEDALAELLRLMDDPVPPLGALNGVHALPPHFLSRPEELDRLKETILLDVFQPMVITSAKQTTALQGMGGVGKSVLAAAFARACETRRAFADGVIWLRFGQEPNLVRNLSLVGQAFDDALQHYLDVQSGKTRLAEVLADRACLLVLDDIWDVTHAEAFLNALGPRCRLLITTRDGGLATALGAKEHRLDVLGDYAALKLLADWSEQSMETLPPEARAVADECGNLPFALALCGAMARDGTPWADLLDALREADLAFIEQQLPNYPYPDVLKSFKVSVDALARTDPLGAQHYQELAVFPPDVLVPEAAVLTLWLHTDSMNERNARKLITTLERKALLRLEGKAPHRYISLHDLQYDYLRVAQDDLVGLHGQLVEAYRQKCSDGWPSGPNDGYFFEHLPYHLLEARQEGELRALLLDFEWLQAKLEATDVNALITDFEWLPQDEVLQLVQSALRRTAHILAEEPTLLAGQLLGRFLCHRSPHIQRLVGKASQWRSSRWLRPLIPSLQSEPARLYRQFQAHDDRVTAIAVLPERGWIVSASDDNTVGVWDMRSGAKVHSLEGHESKVKAIATTRDEKYAVSGSYDHTLILWDMDQGKRLDRLEGHTTLAPTVALDANAQHIVSMDADGSIMLWDFTRRQHIRTVNRDELANRTADAPICQIPSLSDRGRLCLQAWDYLRTSGIHLPQGLTIWSDSDPAKVSAGGRYAILGQEYPNQNSFVLLDLETNTLQHTWELPSVHNLSVALAPDNRQLLYGTLDGTVTLWDIANDQSVDSWQAHPTAVTAIAVTADSRYAVTGDESGTIKIWDLEPDASSTVTLQTDQVQSGAGQVLHRLAEIASDGREAITVEDGSTLRLWQLTEPINMNQLGVPTGRANVTALIPDKSWAVSAVDDKLIIWDIHSHRDVYAIDTPQGRLIPAKFTPDGRYAVIASDTQVGLRLTVWDIAQHKRLRTMNIRGLEANINLHQLALAPDGSHAAVLATNYASEGGHKAGTAQYRILIFRLKDGKEVERQVWERSFVEWFPMPEIAVTKKGQVITEEGAVAVAPGSRFVARARGNRLEVNGTAFYGVAPFTKCAVAADGKTVMAVDRGGQVHFLRLVGGE